MTSHLVSGGCEITGTVDENAWNAAHNTGVAPAGNRRNEVLVPGGSWDDDNFHTIEWYFKFNTTGDCEAGDMKIWIDGVRAFTCLFVAGAEVLESGGSVIRMMIFDFLNTAPASDQDVWVGDVVYSQVTPGKTDALSFPFIGV